jgi:hypothetical protein
MSILDKLFGKKNRKPATVQPMAEVQPIKTDLTNKMIAEEKESLREELRRELTDSIREELLRNTSKSNVTEMIKDPARVYELCGIQDRFTDSLRDQGYSSKIPEDFTKCKEAFIKDWEELEDSHKKAVASHLMSLDSYDFLKAWSKLQYSLTKTLR